MIPCPLYPVGILTRISPVLELTVFRYRVLIRECLLGYCAGLLIDRDLVVYTSSAMLRDRL